MGILYWQLNDVWQGPSWSSIEVDGTPKLVHHAVRRAFAPLLLSAVRTPSERGSPAGQIEVHVTSDLTAAASGALTIDVLRWADAPAVPAANLSLRVAAPPLGSREGPRCAACGGRPKAGAKLSRCARCKNVSYCSAECQRGHWPKHKAACVQVAR